jgi:hypothetical protein
MTSATAFSTSCRPGFEVREDPLYKKAGALRRIAQAQARVGTVDEALKTMAGIKGQRVSRGGFVAAKALREIASARLKADDIKGALNAMDALLAAELRPTEGYEILERITRRQAEAGDPRTVLLLGQGPALSRLKAARPARPGRGNLRVPGLDTGHDFQAPSLIGERGDLSCTERSGRRRSSVDVSQIRTTLLCARSWGLKQ